MYLPRVCECVYLMLYTSILTFSTLAMQFLKKKIFHA